MSKKVSIEFNSMELGQLEAALVKYHNSILDKRRKLRASERAVWLVEIKGIIAKVRAAMEEAEKKD